MTLRICYLYPNLMNTYGDQGNVMALVQRLRWRGIKSTVTNVSLHDKLPVQPFDIYLIGGGQDNAQAAIAADLITKATALKAAIDEGAVLLAVCGGYQLLGNTYVDPTGREVSGVGLFDVVTKAGQRRMVGNLLVTATAVVPGAQLVGFENHAGQTILGPTAIPFATVTSGFGNNGEDATEGVVYKNAIGTYLHGSVLPNNPKLADRLLALALERRYDKVELKPLDDTLAHKTVAETLSRFTK